MRDDLIQQINSSERRAISRSVLFSSIPIIIAIAATVYTSQRLAEASKADERVRSANREALRIEQVLQRTKAEFNAVMVRIQSAQAQLPQVEVLINSVAQRPGEAKDSALVAVWQIAPPKQGWCYQEVKAGRFLVACHWSMDRCMQAKQYSSSATKCSFVADLPGTGWSPRAKGYMGSWFEEAMPALRPPPFPQFQSAPK
jgi:hypothetical protein